MPLVFLGDHGCVILHSRRYDDISLGMLYTIGILISMSKKNVSIDLVTKTNTESLVEAIMYAPRSACWPPCVKGACWHGCCNEECYDTAIGIVVTYQYKVKMCSNIYYLQ